MKHAWVKSEPADLSPEEQRNVRKDFGKQVGRVVEQMDATSSKDPAAFICKALNARLAFPPLAKAPELWSVRSRLSAGVFLVFWVDVANQIVWLVLAYKAATVELGLRRSGKRRAIAEARVGDILMSIRGGSPGV